MPANKNKKKKRSNAYFHVLNRSFSGENLFKDEKDYNVFLNYLEDYLSPPAHPDTYKKEFSIKGRTYKGIPHRNKNYFDNISLIAYDLKPNHFHLLLHQKSNGTVEKLMRSLSTRYSMYHNKRHGRSGKLFEGPYKSIRFNSISPLLLLTHYLHKNSEGDIYDMEEVYSSYEEYIGKRETLWVKPKAVLASFNRSKSVISKKINTYKQFIEKYNLTEKDKKQLERIILEKDSERLTRSTPSLASSSPSKDTQPLSSMRSSHIASSIAGFIVLFSIGLNNVITTTAKDGAQTIALEGKSVTQTITSETSAPTVIGEKTEKPKAKLILVVAIGNEIDSVNIRKEPNTNSEVIGKAKSDDFFDFVSINSGWYGVRLDDDEIGYIHSKYIETYKNE